MSVRDLRTQLVADLSELALEIPVLEAWPDRPTPPAVWVVPGSPYMTRAPFSEWLVNLDVVVLVARANRADQLTDLEQLVEIILTKLSNWGIASVEQPSLVTISGIEYFGTVITVNNLIGL